MSLDKNYKSVVSNIATVSTFSNVLLETQFGESSTLYGIRIELLTGNISSFEFSLELRSDSVGASYDKVYPFETSDTIIGSPVMDIEFLNPIEVSSGFFVKCLGETVAGMEGAENLKVSLYYI